MRRAVDGDERPARARAAACGARAAISSLPVPLSPVMSTVLSVCASCATTRSTCCICGSRR